MSRVLLMMIQSLTKILRIMNKKVIWKGIFTVIKYVATLVLGYLGGTGDLQSLI